MNDSEPKIETLVEDIYDLLDRGLPREYDEERIADFGSALSRIIVARLADRDPRKGTLRMSNSGTPCSRKLWYEVNLQDEKEPLPPQARLKFLYGDILEELLLFLAEAAGHRVEGRQDPLSVEGIDGHRDAVVDGVTLDTKSASTYSFKKFEAHGLEGNDPFGYIDQIQNYIEAGQDDPLVTDKERGAFLVVDKTLGNLCLDIHPKRNSELTRSILNYKKDVVSRPEPPARKYDPEPDGKSGNMRLSLPCSYCDFNKTCYPEQRTFLYSNKPVTLVKIVREPNVPELRGQKEQGPLGQDI